MSLDREKMVSDLWKVAIALVALNLYMKAAEFVVPRIWPEVEYPAMAALLYPLLVAFLLAVVASVVMFFYDRWTEADSDE